MKTANTIDALLVYSLLRKLASGIPKPRKMNSIKDVATVTKTPPDVVKINFGFEDCQRQPIFKKALKPFLTFLQIFGLYYDLSKHSSCKRSTGLLVKCYCYVILICLAVELARSVSAFFYLEPNSDIFFSMLLFVFYTKCGLQALACMQLSPLSCSCRLWNFIETLEQFLSEIKLKNCAVIEKKFMRKVRIWLYVFIFTFLTSFFFQVGIVINYSILHKNATESDMGELVELQIHMSKPLPNKVEFMFGTAIINAYAYGAWFLPAALCGILSQCVTYAYNEFYRYLYNEKAACLTSQSMCVKAHAQYVREQCNRLTVIVKELDDMVKYIYLVSFSLDIVLICINLRVAIFSLSEWPARLFVCWWLISPLFTLVALSLTSSQIVERGEEMNDLVRRFKPVDVNPDLQVELQLLMFQLQTQPAVMSIYGMIPLHKSIIISIFVSIVTYFALLVTL